ncbi:hypothetical protein EDM22_07085 [Agromyces tardus]|uniref:Acyltransferase n=2 Tax=Agromyces tardus TaxID=2583849 RepID=A0A3M8AGX9_9MICO|nr:hypothetical protein EDM22_07085 [Agromyces tardus]
MRTVAIILALFSHMMIITGGWTLLQDQSSDAYLAVRSITRTATPMFILLAGATVELAYTRYWRANHRYGTRRLLTQSLKCFIALGVIGIAAVVSGMIAPVDFLLSLVAVRAIPNAEIFVFYVVFFVIAVPLVAFRVRYGLAATLALAASWWIIAELVPSPPHGSPRLAIARIFGIGDLYGPSTFHAMLLAVVGMVLADAVRNRGGKSIVRRWWLFSVCLMVAVGIVAWLVAQAGPLEVVRSYVTSSEYRFTNHPGYYAVGLLASSVAFLAAYVVWAAVFRGAVFSPGPFGGDSLIAFTAGNTAINLLVPLLPAPSLGVAIAESAALIIGTWIFVLAFRRFRPKPSARFAAPDPVAVGPGPAEPSLP